MSVKITESDYRAWLAFMWTIFTFTIVLFLIYRGNNMQDITTAVSVFLPLDAVFIQSYFKSKE